MTDIDALVAEVGEREAVVRILREVGEALAALGQRLAESGEAPR